MMRPRYLHIICLFFGLGLFCFAQDVLTISAAQNVTAAAGQTVSVTVQGNADPVVLQCPPPLVCAESQGSIIGNWRFTVGLPASVSPGIYSFQAFGRAIPSGALIASSRRTITVSPTVMPQSLTWEPGVVSFRYPGDEAALRLVATLPDGKTQDVLNSPQVTITLPTNITRTGSRFTSTGPGTGMIRATYTWNGSTLSKELTFNVPTGLPGDLDGDGIVGEGDLNLLTAMLGRTPASTSDARDLNSDGKIDASDVDRLRSFFTRPPCQYTVDRTAVSVPAGGDKISLRVQTATTCEWMPKSNALWINASPQASTPGSARFQLDVSTNQATTRTATAEVARIPLTIWQATAGCVFTPALSATVVAATESTANLTVTTTPGCSWKAVAAPAWASFPAGSEGTGTATIAVRFAANASSLPRTGLIEVAGQAIQVLQQRSGAGTTAPFTDVPVGHAFADHITLMKEFAITSGCSATTYCPDNPVTRGQMAVFVVRALLGGDNFPYSAAPYFSDVPPHHSFFKWIQKLRELGVTNGCSATTYCPNDPVTRGQMSAFLIRGRMGITPDQTIPHQITRTFADVPAGHTFFPYVQKMREIAVTQGCTATGYCPDEPTTRGQMAAFIIRAFFAP